MTAKPVKVCPACRRPARNRPLPPDGFWQEQVLQRIGMYPYRCEACGARFFRKVKVGESVAPPRRPATHPQPPSASPGGSSPASSAASRGASPAAKAPAPDPGPRLLTDPEAPDEPLSHDDFVDLIDHIKQAERREGLDVLPEDDEEK